MLNSGVPGYSGLVIRPSVRSVGPIARLALLDETYEALRLIAVPTPF